MVYHPSRVFFLVMVMALAVTVPVAAQQKSQFPKTLDFKGQGVSAGKLHFDPAVLGAYSLIGEDIAKSAASILGFQDSVWEIKAPIFWDVYVVHQRADKAGNAGTTTLSATRKVAGATKPGPRACVTLLVLENIRFTKVDYKDLFSSRVDFVMAHEATHCFQRITSTKQNETVAYEPSDWFMEGSASWLAGNYLESTGREYPNYFEPALRDHHQERMLHLNDHNHFFFKWLEGSQGLGTRKAVIGFVRDMLEVPWSKCVAHLPVEDFPDERKDVPVEDCGTSPYEAVVKQWFAARKVSVAQVLSMFGSALVRGTVPGIREPHRFLKEATLTIQPGFNAARASLLAIPTLLLPTQLGKIAPFSKPVGKEQGLPQAFGFVVFKVKLSEPLVPPPAHGYQFAMEGADQDIHALLSRKQSDTMLDKSRWVRADALEGQWFSVARSDPAKGENALLLLRAEL